MTQWHTGMKWWPVLPPINCTGAGTHMGALAIAAFHSTNFPLTSLNLSQQKSQNTSSQMSAYMIRHNQLAEDNYRIYTSLMRTFFFHENWYENCLCITKGYETKTVPAASLSSELSNTVQSPSTRRWQSTFSCSTTIWSSYISQSLKEVLSLPQDFVWLSTRCVAIYGRQRFWHCAKLAICAQCQKTVGRIL